MIKKLILIFLMYCFMLKVYPNPLILTKNYYIIWKQAGGVSRSFHKLMPSSNNIRCCVCKLKWAIFKVQSLLSLSLQPLSSESLVVPSQSPRSAFLYDLVSLVNWEKGNAAFRGFTIGIGVGWPEFMAFRGRPFLILHHHCICF